MNDELKIRIFDDDDERSSEWADDLGEMLEEHDVGVLEHEDLLESILPGLIERRRSPRPAQETATEGSGNDDEANVGEATEPDNDAEFNLDVDDIDVLIIDYDLLDLKSHEQSGSVSVLSGEDIAYLVRCYSSCRYIVILNQYGENAFNLKLRRNHRSFADLNIGSEQICNRGLWSNDWPDDDFRPWYWPVIPDEVEAYNDCVDSLKENVDEPVFAHLGFSAEDLRYFSTNAIEFIADMGGDAPPEPMEVTFKQFVRESGNGLRLRDEIWNPAEMVPRIAAARIRRWLDGTVLAAQNILVDAPHLAMRLPALVEDGTWKNLCRLASVDEPTKPEGFDSEGRLDNFAYQHQIWLSRPTWRWNDIRTRRGDEGFEGLWRAPRPEHVFCEDASAFQPDTEARVFRADVPTPYNERYVLGPDKFSEVTYQPRVRMAM